NPPDEVELRPSSASSQIASSQLSGGSEIWLVLNKLDLVNRNESGFSISERESQFRHMLLVSARTDDGMNELVNLISQYAERFFAEGESCVVSRERHRRALRETLEALDRGIRPEVVGREEVMAEELRLAARALGRLTGRVDVEDILDVIFRD